MIASDVQYVYSRRGHPWIVLNDYLYFKNRGIYWRCLGLLKYKCPARLVLCNGKIERATGIHTHANEYERIRSGKLQEKHLIAGNSDKETEGEDCRNPNIKTKRRRPQRLIEEHDGDDKESSFLLDENMVIKNEIIDDDAEEILY